MKQSVSPEALAVRHWFWLIVLSGLVLTSACSRSSQPRELLAEMRMSTSVPYDSEVHRLYSNGDIEWARRGQKVFAHLDSQSVTNFLNRLNAHGFFLIQDNLSGDRDVTHSTSIFMQVQWQGMSNSVAVESANTIKPRNESDTNCIRFIHCMNAMNGFFQTLK